MCKMLFNACTLVPTVFLRHGKTEFELALSVFVYPRHQKNGIRDSIFVFRFSNTLKMKFQLVFWFVFRFPTTLKLKFQLYFRFSFSHYFGKQNCNWNFRFLILRFRKTLKTEFEPRFSFPCCFFIVFLPFLNLQNTLNIPSTHLQWSWPVVWLSLYLFSTGFHPVRTIVWNFLQLDGYSEWRPFYYKNLTTVAD